MFMFFQPEILNEMNSSNNVANKENYNLFNIVFNNNDINFSL